MLLNAPRCKGTAARVHGSGDAAYRSNMAMARSGSRSYRASIGSPIAASG